MKNKLQYLRCSQIRKKNYFHTKKIRFDVMHCQSEMKVRDEPQSSLYSPKIDSFFFPFTWGGKEVSEWRIGRGNEVWAQTATRV